MAIRIINFAHIGTRSAKQIEVSVKYTHTHTHTHTHTNLIEDRFLNVKLTFVS